MGYQNQNWGNYESIWGAKGTKIIYYHLSRAINVRILSFFNFYESFFTDKYQFKNGCELIFDVTPFQKRRKVVPMTAQIQIMQNVCKNS